MGHPVGFDGANKIYGPPPGRDDVGNLPTFFNGTCVVQAWEFTPEEIDEIVRTGRVFISSMSRGVMFPTFVGSESTVRSVVVDYGTVW
jgi:hypothetical protein